MVALVGNCYSSFVRPNIRTKQNQNVPVTHRAYSTPLPVTLTTAVMAPMLYVTYIMACGLIPISPEIMASLQLCNPFYLKTVLNLSLIHI